MSPISGNRAIARKMTKEGFTRSEIAKELGLKESTVRYYASGLERERLVHKKVYRAYWLHFGPAELTISETARCVMIQENAAHHWLHGNTYKRLYDKAIDAIYVHKAKTFKEFKELMK